MQISDFTAEIEILALAYPKVFPEDAKKKGAMVIIWYDHFQHIPKELFSRAAKWCREHERFLSIAALRESIVANSTAPDEFQAREMIMNDKEWQHPIAIEILEGMGGRWTVNLMTAGVWDMTFEREYKRAKEKWAEEAMQPENVGLLTGTPKLEEHCE